MSIMVGATSGKFVMVAAILLFQTRVNGDPVPAALAPGNPVSALSPRLAGQLSKKRHPGEPIKIGVRGNYFYAAVDTVVADPASKADIVIGQDLLAAHPIEIDFRRHQLTSLLPGEFRARQRRDHAIMLRPDSDGHWHVTLGLPDGHQVDAVFDPGRPESVALGADASVVAAAPPDGTMTLGGVTITGARIWRAPRGVTTIGLGVFAGRRVVFDLGHDRIWVGA